MVYPELWFKSSFSLCTYNLVFRMYLYLEDTGRRFLQNVGNSGTFLGIASLRALIWHLKFSCKYVFHFHCRYIADRFSRMLIKLSSNMICFCGWMSFAQKQMQSMQSTIFCGVTLHSRFPSKCRLTFSRLHRVIAQKIVLFITTALKTLSPTNTVHVFKCGPWVGHEKYGKS
jgi:hypothetical protein